MKSILLFLLLSFTSVFYQKELKVEFDYSTFMVDKVSGIVEIYYGFHKDSMIPKGNNNNLVSGKLSVFIKNNDNNQTLVDQPYDFEDLIKSGKENEILSGLLRYQLSAGNYRLKLTGIDINSMPQQSKVYEANFVVKEMPDDRIAISDIILASRINQFNIDENSIFYRNTLEVIPNTELIYGEKYPAVFFYAEIYNVNKNIKSKQLKVEHLIYNASNVVKYRKTKLVDRKEASIVEIGAINISKYSSGTYSLVVAVTDPDANLTVTSAKKFYIYNPKVKDTNVNSGDVKDILASELGVLTEEELDEAFKLVAYIATEDEKNDWERVSNAEGKRNFLYNFWKKRDANPDTPINETKIEYYKRVDFANKNFSNLAQKDGWKTDRGRVYIVYGSPSEVERHPNETAKLPFEIWYYNELENGVQFVFADYQGYNDYRLIHSTMTGELSNTNWDYNISR